MYLKRHPTVQVGLFWGRDLAVVVVIVILLVFLFAPFSNSFYFSL